MSPTRILYTIPNLDTAGSWGAMFRVIERLPRDFAASVAVQRSGGEGEAVAAGLGVPVHVVPWPTVERPLHTLLQRCRRAAAAMGQRFDVWHSFDYSGSPAEPVVAWFSGRPAWVYTKKNMNWDRRAAIRAHLADGIVAQNTDMIEHLFATPRLRKRARLIPRGVDADRFRPGHPAAGFRRRLGIGDAPVLTSVAHLVPVKGHDVLLHALVDLPGSHLLIAGTGDDVERRRLEAQAAALQLTGRCHFLGAVRDVAGLLAETDVFVHATLAEGRAEGSPVAVLEAMASAKACVVTDVPGSRDLAADRESAVLVPPADPLALARAVRELLDDADRRRRLGEAARARVLERYTINREVAQHVELYRDLLRPPA